MRVFTSMSVVLTDSLTANTTTDSASPLKWVPWNQSFWGVYLISALAMFMCIVF